MNQFIELQIAECEQRLKQVMLRSDVSALDELLEPELIFTNHLGQLITTWRRINQECCKLMRSHFLNKSLKFMTVSLLSPLMLIFQEVLLAKSRRIIFVSLVSGVKHQVRDGRL